MSHYTKEDIIRIVEEEDVEFIRLQFVDIFGILKNMAVTAKQLDSILNNRCTFDAAAINGFDTMHVDELVLVPDLDTFTIFPWRPQRGRVARFICDVRHTDGTPFMGDSRYILKQVIEEAAKDGYTLNVGPESEFFLFDMSEDGQPTTNTSEKVDFLTSDRWMPEKMQDVISCFHCPRWDLRWNLHITPMKCASIISISNLMMEFRQPIIL